MTNSLIELPFGRVRGNVHTSSIARWKARGRLPIRNNWTFFASSYGSDFISRCWSNRRITKGWVTLSANFRWKGTSPINLCWYQKTRVITLSCGIKISAVSSFLSSQSTRVTDRRTDRRMDGRTDGQSYDSRDRASIAVSRGKNMLLWWLFYFVANKSLKGH